jgi:PPOX class probable F420-dependent enzyme
MSQDSSPEPSFVNSIRVARLATADSTGAPHVVPICFAYDGESFYSVLDQKPKRAPIERLKRVRNILSNPRVSLVLDHYDEDWSRLWYGLVMGTALLLRSGPEHGRAIRLLRRKYVQYEEMSIDASPVIRIDPERMTWWGKPRGRGA